VPATSSTGNYQVSWGASSGAVSYDLEESTSPTFGSTINIYTGANLSFNVAGKQNGTYYYRVRAKNSWANTAWTTGTNGCVVTLFQPPATVNVPATSTTGYYMVSWSSVAGAVSYDLEEDTDLNFTNPIQHYGLTNASFNVMGKTDGTYYYRARAFDGSTSSNWTLGGNGCVVTLGGTLTLREGLNNFPRTEIAGTTGAPILQFELEADLVEDITVTAITFADTGDLDLSTQVAMASLYRDMNGDGLLDGGDFCIASVANPTGDGYFFSGLAETINATTTTTLLLVYDLAASAPLGATMRARVVTNGDVSIVGSMTQNTQVVGAPITGDLKTIGQLGSLAIATNLGSLTGTVLPGAQGAAVFRIRFAAGSAEGVRVTSISVTAQGTGNEFNDVQGAFLYFDADANGVLDLTVDNLISGPETFLNDNGSITFPAYHAVGAGSAENFFVVYNLAPGTAEGSTFCLGVLQMGDVEAEGVNTLRSIPVAGAPYWGGTITVSSPTQEEESVGAFGCSSGTNPGGPAGLLSLMILLLSFLFGTARAKRLVRRAE
jgi:hypothetical protein